MAHIPGQQKRTAVFIPPSRRGRRKVIKARIRFEKRLSKFKTLKASPPKFFAKARTTFARKRTLKAGRKFVKALRNNRGAVLIKRA